MVITRKVVADKLSAYLQGQQRLADLVSWAEEAMREGEFDESDFRVIRDVVARLGLADVAAFGLTWEDAVLHPNPSAPGSRLSPPISRSALANPKFAIRIPKSDLVSPYPRLL